MPKETVPAVIENYAIMQMPQAELQELVEENMMGEDLGMSDLPRIKFPSGGSTMWTVLDENGEEDACKELSGVLLYSHQHRGFWMSSLEESGSQAPDCRSSDGRTGEWCQVDDDGNVTAERPEGWTGNCGDCAFAQFGSGKGGRGQACRLMHRSFLLQENTLLPVIINVPPTSLKPFKTYRTLLTNNGIAYFRTLTKISLIKETTPDNVAYACADFKKGETLTGEGLQQLIAYRTSLLPMLKATETTAEDFGNGNGE